MGARAGVDEVRAGVLPEGKAGFVRELRASGLRVAMVGDGINDALALAAAGLLNPLIAAAAMTLSSTFVVWSSLRLRRLPGGRSRSLRT